MENTLSISSDESMESVDTVDEQLVDELTDIVERWMDKNGKRIILAWLKLKGTQDVLVKYAPKDSRRSLQERCTGITRDGKLG